LSRPEARNSYNSARDMQERACIRQTLALEFGSSWIDDATGQFRRVTRRRAAIRPSGPSSALTISSGPISRSMRPESEIATRGQSGQYSRKSSANSFTTSFDKVYVRTAMSKPPCEWRQSPLHGTREWRLRTRDRVELRRGRVRVPGYVRTSGHGCRGSFAVPNAGGREIRTASLIRFRCRGPIPETVAP